ncbi:outer membrane beta-barrel protein [Marinospirillum perlucidum]|uniref:outer membrane beta-barrel protein n=1 Tax=Marinospirillum perlucidum TaxID=1982602 RepID=UPI00138FF090|nr:outer membrane beta-barrel protein [Marinospirillum perlucidum]
MKHWIAAGGLLLSVLLVAAPAQAYYDDYSDVYRYAGGGLHMWNNGDGSAMGAKLHYGQQLDAFVGAEAQLGIAGSTEEEITMDWLFGGYLRFTLPLNGFTPFAKVGLTSVSLNDGDTSTTDFGWGYGLGFEFDLPYSSYASIEYMSYLTADAEGVDTNLNALTLGAGYKF